MAKPIGTTPTLYGKEAERFLKKMEEPPTKKEKELSERIRNQRKVLF